MKLAAALGINAHDIKSGAIFSACRLYRYALWRTWDDALPMVLFIGLNPSTADVEHNDPTARRCIGFAQRWGYGGVYMTNLFAYKATQPAQLKAAAEPIGPKTDTWLMRLYHSTDVAIAAWGNHGNFRGRDRIVRQMLPRLHYLRLTQQGQPAHPLYLKADLQPIPLPGFAPSNR